jgi:hypothetical protein
MLREVNMFRTVRWLIAVILCGMALQHATPALAQGKNGAQSRPVLADEQTYGTDKFLIHYTFTGDAAIDPTDTNLDGAPDYINNASNALTYSWEVEINQMGWSPPPLDDGEGGDQRFDVYIEQLMPDGIAGYAGSDGGYVGDNPQTPELERRAAYSYLSLDNDYAEILGSGGNETPLQLMQVTVAHEFNHVLQAGYDDFDPQYWLYEATASWVEDEVYPDVNDNISYIADLAAAPDRCRASTDLAYGSWLFLRMLSEHYGQGIVQEIWALSRQYDGFDAIDRALLNHGSSLVQESQNFGVMNLLRAYQDGALYPSFLIEGQSTGSEYTPQSGVQSLGVDYIQLSLSTPTTISLTGDGLSGRLVGIRFDGQADVIEMVGNSATVTPSGYQTLYAVVHNDLITGEEQDCAYLNYTLAFAPALGTDSPITTLWNAGKYISPAESTASTGSSSSAPYHPLFATGESSSSPESLVTSFSFVTPARAPDGFNFDYAYLMTPEDFGASANYYVPGGEDSANFDYRDQDGNWLSISQTPSPYSSLNDWLADINYQPQSSSHIISGVEVLVEDLSTDTEASFSATLIVNGLFIVVDSNRTQQDVEDMATYMIAAADVRELAPTATSGQDIQPLLGEGGQAAPSDNLLSTLWLLAGGGLVLACGAVCVLVPLVVWGFFIFRRKPPA